MKKNKKIFIKIIFLIIILLISIFLVFNFKKNKQFDDILFIKLFQNSDSNIKQSPNKNIYKFNINYKNTKLIDVNLVNTANKDTIVNEKIAPGTSGQFFIILNATEKSIYKVDFLSKNEKPQNLEFSAFLQDKQISTEKNSLEELGKDINGTIEKNQTKIITIKWCWNYEIKKNQNEQEQKDIQDTLDGINLKKYEFYITTFGEKIL